jgi:carbon-monoxide dehydrogenase medium subunit
VLAGGQSLIPLLAMRLARPAVLIDINGIDELYGVSAADGWMTVGAMTREYVAEESGTVGDAVPLLAAALPLIGHEAIRSRGTIGGSLAHADPAAELPTVARALDAEFVVRGPSGEPVRAADAEDLLIGETPSAELFEEAARRATGDLDPPADLHGSSDYRKKVAAALVRRGLREAADGANYRANEGQ